VDTSNSIGRIISHHGLFEMPVVEAIFRLTTPADLFLDVGANIGYMSSAAVKAGAKKILSFEPHPLIFRELKHNFSMWAESSPEIANRISARQEAISDKVGTAQLRWPKIGFSENTGISSLEGRRNASDYNETEVLTTTLTRIFEQCGEPIGVLKIDIEEHEMTAFRASENLLRAGNVRDIIFEDWCAMQSETSQFLANFGYSLFGLNKTLFGPVLLESAEAVANFQTRSHEPTINFLATRDPHRAKERFSGRGFWCLGANGARLTRGS
jgi:FkbM family methyltransferase